MCIRDRSYEEYRKVYSPYDILLQSKDVLLNKSLNSINDPMADYSRHVLANKRRTAQTKDEKLKIARSQSAISVRSKGGVMRDRDELVKASEGDGKGKEDIAMSREEVEVSCKEERAVSYTHLTLPTICSV
eukprot:TRINITY_DN6290_c0_g1_i1.p1 TRINITY_DN6290_c0_g1~~TRINITY_DN6290_c0_g1_i1.p1  ORF type:complete len:131 (+),score=28.50 TRINITY_DN6290_c0_g1_i1:64-456(+)